tara:strand:+ start:11087 stop:11341 length:255 start_codon:yes stop_codon:yes gene_type:complete
MGKQKRDSGRPEFIDFSKRREADTALERMRNVLEIRTLADVEREAMIVAWVNTGHKAETAAQLLGISRATFYRKMQKYGIDRWA